jgi:hypothetical protein
MEQVFALRRYLFPRRKARPMRDETCTPLRSLPRCVSARFDCAETQRDKGAKKAFEAAEQFDVITEMTYVSFYEPRDESRAGSRAE